MTGSSSAKKETRRLGLLADLGHALSVPSRICDLGCGNGNGVREYLALGHDAYGCDLQFKEGPHVGDLERAGRLRRITMEPYALPFEDDMFDFLYSEYVLEHVQNYDEMLAEIHRVLRPGGVSLHVFAPRYSPIEPHVKAPLATLIQGTPWMFLCMSLGFSRPMWQGRSRREAAREASEYLRTRTNYLGTRRIRKLVEARFPTYRFCEKEALGRSGFARYDPIVRWIPIAPFLLRNLVASVLFLRKDPSPTP